MHVAPHMRVVPARLLDHAGIATKFDQLQLYELSAASVYPVHCAAAVGESPSSARAANRSAAVIRIWIDIVAGVLAAANIGAQGLAVATPTDPAL